MRRIYYWLRWWRWFLGGPNIGRLVVKGVDKNSRAIIYERHDAKEPVSLSLPHWDGDPSKCSILKVGTVTRTSAGWELDGWDMDGRGSYIAKFYETAPRGWKVTVVGPEEDIFSFGGYSMQELVEIQNIPTRFGQRVGPK